MSAEENTIPCCWCNHSEQSTVTGLQSLGVALRRTSSRDTSTVYRSCIPVRVSRMVSTGIQRLSLQSAVTQDQARSLPVAASLGKQNPEVPLLHLEENICSTRLPGPEKNEKDLSVISHTEPSHVLKTSTQRSRHASQETSVKYRSCIT